jgi:orotate phosphoribosyltransferase/AMMECR1 domain-containing protein
MRISETTAQRRRLHRESWSESLARLPASFHADREELLRIMRKEAILYRSDTQPVLSRDGTSARWMLNSLQVTLTPRGTELAGRCVLHLLKRFEGRQIATLGLTAVPILNSVLMQSKGRYHGLLIRHERKKHGSLKLVEGPIDRSEPTILIDDSISSGLSMERARDTLRDHGIRVEGAICLVRFGWYGGFARLQEEGYRVDAVSDIWTDFIYHMDDEPKPIANPTKIFPDVRYGGQAAPDGLHPANLARLAMREYLTTGMLPRPPRTLDAGYAADGGAWVSVRALEEIYLRHARDGYWNFPGETPHPAPEAVVLAALKTACELPQGKALGVLDQSAIAVTFFGAMEECSVGGLDNDRYGIVVRSLERPGWMGGALPRMPGILNEWDQYQHARTTNADLVSFEPHIILRHDVTKAVQPGIVWQPTGAPAPDEVPPLARADLGGVVARRACDLACARVFGTKGTVAPLADDFLPASVDSLYVSVYLRGHLRGCFGMTLRHLDQDVTRLVEAALGDERFDPSKGASSPAEIAVVVALLHDRVDLGVHSIEDIVRRIRLGQHALLVEQAKRSAVFLPSVVSRFNLDAVAFVEELLEKAKVTRPPYRWSRFECTAWLSDHDGQRLMDGSFAREAAPVTLAELTARLIPLATDYLLRHQRPDGSLFTRYEPLLDQLYESVDLPRLAHAAWVLGRARRHDPAATEAAARMVQLLLAAAQEKPEGTWLAGPGHDASVAEIALLVLALCEGSNSEQRDGWVPRLTATLWSCIDVHGRIRTHLDAELEHDAYQDYFPGQVLLALAVAVREGLTALDEPKLTRAFRYYRHRFRARPHFGQVSWLAQCCAAWWSTRPNADFAELAFEVVDWVIRFQQQKTGGFVNDHQSDTPGYTSALYLEAIGATANLARSAGRARLHRDYLESCRRGLQFLDSLIIQPRDFPLLPNPQMALGGLRRSARGSEICADFVQHGLSALIEISQAMQIDRIPDGKAADAER